MLLMDFLIVWTRSSVGAFVVRYSFIANTYIPLNRVSEVCRINTICFAPLSSKLAASEFRS